jgi:hypothetical protein
MIETISKIAYQIYRWANKSVMTEMTSPFSSMFLSDRDSDDNSHVISKFDRSTNVGDASKVSE